MAEEEGTQYNNMSVAVSEGVSTRLSSSEEHIMRLLSIFLIITHFYRM